MKANCNYSVALCTYNGERYIAEQLNSILSFDITDITCRGLFEFDDIIHNGVGCMMGAVLGSWCWLRMLKKFKMLRKPHAS